MNVFAVMLLFLVLIFVLMLTSTWFFNMYMRSTVGKKHCILEELTDSCNVPREWTRKFEMKHRSALADPSRSEALRQAGRQYYLHELQRLVSYINKTKLVDSEETRSIMLGKLDSIRKKWEGGTES